MRNKLPGPVLLLSIALVLPGVCTMAQDVPSRPLSIPVYHPMVLNPAFVGSKDFTNISITSKVLDRPENQIINLHTRLFESDGVYSNWGIGSYLFREKLEQGWNGGLAVAGAYHLSLDEDHVHLLSVGASAKGILNGSAGNGEQASDTSGTAFNPNLDFGVYYYGPNGFAGLSTTSVLGTGDDIGIDSEAYIPRQYHFYGGYKFMIVRNPGIVVEPSLLVSLNDSTVGEPHRHLVPYLKIYLQNFYVGSYLKDRDIFALFFQYQFPRLYTGVFLEFPRVGFLNDENIIFELSLGVNLGRGGLRFLQYRHW